MRIARAVSFPRRSAGQMLVAIAFIVTLFTGAVLYAFASWDTRRHDDVQTTATVLAQAREALIGRAAADNNRPGTLPCPDISTNIPGTNIPNDGIADLLSGNECPNYIGRLPWRTLGLSDLRDASGERLWYVLSRSFRDDDSAQPINTNTAGTLSITGKLTASNVIAIVFSPGGAVGTQVRDAANANSVANYLEGGNEVSGTTAFNAAAPGATFNDQLLAITSDVLFPIVEARVAREARTVLSAFYNSNGFLPYANAYGDGTYRCTDARYSGRIPRFFADWCKINPSDADWTGASWPAWFFANTWHEVIFYAVSPKCAAPASPACSGPGSFLTVNGQPAPNNNIRSIVIMPGRAFAGQSRPCATASDCLEDAANTDGDVIFSKSPITPTANDRLLVVSQ
jgi:hypothetical protein